MSKHFVFTTRRMLSLSRSHLGRRRSSRATSNKFSFSPFGIFETLQIGSLIGIPPWISASIDFRRSLLRFSYSLLTVSCVSRRSRKRLSRRLSCSNLNKEGSISTSLTRRLCTQGNALRYAVTPKIDSRNSANGFSTSHVLREDVLFRGKYQGQSVYFDGFRTIKFIFPNALEWNYSIIKASASALRTCVWYQASPSSF